MRDSALPPDPPTWDPSMEPGCGTCGDCRHWYEDAEAFRPGWGWCTTWDCPTRKDGDGGCDTWEG